METHVFNKQKKRLEPIDNRCAWCGKGVSRGEEDNAYVSLYKEGDRTNLLVYRSVKFSRIDIGVPRCEKCKQIQKRIKWHSAIYSLLIALGIVLVSAVLGIYVFINLLDYITLGGIVLLLGVIAAIFVGFLNGIEEKLMRKYSIQSVEQVVSSYDIVDALVNDGWSFIKPSA